MTTLVSSVRDKGISWVRPRKSMWISYKLVIYVPRVGPIKP